VANLQTGLAKHAPPFARAKEVERAGAKSGRVWQVAQMFRDNCFPIRTQNTAHLGKQFTTSTRPAQFMGRKHQEDCVHHSAFQWKVAEFTEPGARTSLAHACSMQRFLCHLHRIENIEHG
jgi:hypothetical protein